MKYFWILVFCGLALASCKGGKEEGAAKSDVGNQTAVLVPEEKPLPPDQILSPLDSIKELDRKIESYKTGSNLTPEEVEANRKLKHTIIHGTFDLYELCRLALDVHWGSLAEKDRSYFADLMTRLLERKAIFSKEQVKGEERPYRVVYKNQQFLDAEKKTSQVFTQIIIPSEKIDLNINYKLTLTPYGWKIFDVIVDEASLVENYKFQFDTIIRKNGYPELVSRMEKKLKEME